jgi:UDP-N-acetylmuramate--alanine ligase
MAKRYFFCGIGGSGMSAIAQVLIARGHEVSGSDRSLDQGKNKPLFKKLKKLGIKLFPQDGKAIRKTHDVLVVSSAIENTIPDVKAAKKKGVKIMKRAEVLADLLHEGQGIAVAGTSGKTTTTGMLGHILSNLSAHPTVINGGLMLNYLDQGLGNVINGESDLIVIEADESDGSIELYSPDLAILNNIAKDHKSLDELRSLFELFISKASRAVVLNVDCPEASQLEFIHENTLTFAIDNQDADLIATNIECKSGAISFMLDDIEVELQVPGRYNVYNALAAIAAAEQLGHSRYYAAVALHSFKGIGRRMQLVGEKNNIKVIDDFAHNPDKIAAALESLTLDQGKLFIIYQPHGFGPTRFVKDELINAFIGGLRDYDELIMPEIYYAGGTADKDISSVDLSTVINATSKTAHFIEHRKDVKKYVLDNVEPGDRIVIMGARDDTLTEFAVDLLKGIK